MSEELYPLKCSENEIQLLNMIRGLGISAQNVSKLIQDELYMKHLAEECYKDSEMMRTGKRLE